MRVLINELSSDAVYIIVWVITGLTIVGFIMLSNASNYNFFYFWNVLRLPPQAHSQLFIPKLGMGLWM